MDRVAANVFAVAAIFGAGICTHVLYQRWNPPTAEFPETPSVAARASVYAATRATVRRRHRTVASRRAVIAVVCCTTALLLMQLTHLLMR